MGKLSIEKNKVLREWKETEIGKIPKDWGIVNIEDLLSDKKNAIAMGPFGSNITKDNFVSNGVPIIRGNNLKPYKFSEEDFVYVTKEKSVKLKASWVERKDLVITHRGTLGQVCIIPENSKYEKYIISQSGLKISLDEKKINPFFCYYFLRSRIGQHLLLRNKSQVGVPAIAQPTTSIKKIPIPIPALYVQEKIAKILSDLDDKIEINNEMNKTLEEMTQTLFKRWFIDFEFPNENGELYKSSGGKMVESELGMIPEGWKVGSLENIGLIASGGTPSKSKNEYYTSNGIPWITPKDLSVNKNKFIIRGAVDITEEGLTKSSAKLLPKGTILFSSRAPIGYLAIAKVDVSTNQGFKSIVPNNFENTEFIYQLLKEITPYIESVAGGSTFKEISSQGMKSINIIIPSDLVLKKFHQITNSFNKKIQSLEKEIQFLTETRDTLLSKLMSGEIVI